MKSGPSIQINESETPRPASAPDGPALQAGLSFGDAMKITVMFKTPDAADLAIEHITDEAAYHEADEFIGQFVRHGEIVSIEFDTEAKTATVLKL